MYDSYITDCHMLDLGMKKGSATLLILSLIENEARHGYDLSKRIASLSRGVLKFHVASLYPLLYKLEDKGLIEGKWIEKPAQRRRRFYRITPAGRKYLHAQRQSWAALVEAVGRVTGEDHA